MSHCYWIKIGEKVKGPLTSKQLIHLASLGKLKPHWLISSDQEKWISIERVKGISFHDKFHKSTTRPAPSLLEAPSNELKEQLLSRRGCIALHTILGVVLTLCGIVGVCFFTINSKFVSTITIVIFNLLIAAGILHIFISFSWAGRSRVRVKANVCLLSFVYVTILCIFTYVSRSAPLVSATLGLLCLACISGIILSIINAFTGQGIFRLEFKDVSGESHLLIYGQDISLSHLDGHLIVMMKDKSKILERLKFTLKSEKKIREAFKHKDFEIIITYDSRIIEINFGKQSFSFDMSEVKTKIPLAKFAEAPLGPLNELVTFSKMRKILKQIVYVGEL